MKYLSLLVILILNTFNMDASAQFRKYKARTQLQDENAEGNRDGSGNTPAPPPPGRRPSPNADPSRGNRSFGRPGNQDFFGPGNGNSRRCRQTEEQKRFVNLNPDTGFGPEVVTNFNFPDTSLLELTKYMQKLTGINLIWDKDIKGKMTILAPSPITVGDAWKAYLTALNANNYMLIKSGAFYKIVSSRDARISDTKIYSGPFTPQVDNFLMKVMPLKNIKSTEIQRNFRPYMNKNGRIINIAQTNTVILLDTGTNVNRLVRLIRFLDVPGHEESLHIIRMKHSSAQEVAKLLDSILKGGSGSSRRIRNNRRNANNRNRSNISKIIAEPRTNSIIALANAQGIKQLKSLVAKLDVKYGSQSSDKIHVYYLNYGSAEELAKTLSSLVSDAQQSRRSNQRSNLARRPILNRRGNEPPGLFSADIKITADKTQ